MQSKYAEHAAVSHGKLMCVCLLVCCISGWDEGSDSDHRIPYKYKYIYINQQNRFYVSQSSITQIPPRMSLDFFIAFHYMRRCRPVILGRHYRHECARALARGHKFISLFRSIFLLRCLCFLHTWPRPCILCIRSPLSCSFSFIHSSFPSIFVHLFLSPAHTHTHLFVHAHSTVYAQNSLFISSSTIVCFSRLSLGPYHQPLFCVTWHRYTNANIPFYIRNCE